MKKKMLLQTIKLPSDLTKLKDKLPNSKYESAKMQSRSAVMEQPAPRGGSSQRILAVHDPIINRS